MISFSSVWYIFRICSLVVVVCALFAEALALSSQSAICFNIVIVLTFVARCPIATAICDATMFLFQSSRAAKRLAEPLTCAGYYTGSCVARSSRNTSQASYFGLQCVPLIRTVLGDTMAIRSRGNRPSSTSQRDAVLGRDPLFSSPRLLGLDQARAIVRAIEDRRTFHPLRELRPARATRRASARTVVSPAKLAGRFPPTGLSFSVPRDVAVCVRRKTRREVIFAFKKAGKGSRARKRRRNAFSDKRC